MSKIASLRSKLSESLWFVPILMPVFSIVLAIGLIQLDIYLQIRRLTDLGFFFGLGADGSRGMLTAIGSSMLTIAALTFSLTLLAVSQASSQYSPRVIRSFLRDRASQFILGYFVSVFAYCLIVLRTIRGGDGETFIPSISVLTGLLLAIGGVIVLIFFIHHVAASLQVANVIENIVRLTRSTMDERYPVTAGQDWRDSKRFVRDGKEWKAVPSHSSGYVEDCDASRLEKFATKNGFLVRVERDIGDFVPAGGALALITRRGSGATRIDADRATVNEVNEAFEIGIQRTNQKDVMFGITQLVDIALKALSAGINDTTTALICIDRLGEIAGLLAEREIPDDRTVTESNVIMARAPEFKEYMRTCFDQIRHNARGKLAVFIRLADAIAHAATRPADDARRQVLLEQMDLVKEYAAKTLETDDERLRFREHVKILAETVGASA